MRRITMASLALAFAIGGTTAVSAQEGPPRRPRAEGEFRAQRGPGGPAGFLLRDIELSDQQKQQLKAVFEKNRPERGGQRHDAFRTRMRDAREKGDTAQLRQLRTEAMQRMAQQRTELNQQIRAILTPEQRTQFDKNVAAMKDRVEMRRERRNEDRGEHPARQKRPTRPAHPAEHSGHGGRQ